MASGLYQIKALRGYRFKKKPDLLTGYVEEFFKMKAGAKDSVTRSVAKLLLNSLYGRLGMKQITYETIISDDTFVMDNLLNIEEIEGHSNKFIYTVLTEKARVVSNVAIAAAITSYSRMKSFNVIRKYENSIMYHDTDSFVLNSPIGSEYLGEGLGEMKNVAADGDYRIENDAEYYITDAIFVSPKVYSYRTKNGGEVVKIKGIRKPDQTREVVERLYHDMNITSKTTQFMRYIKKLEVVVKRQERALRLHNNKREKVYKQGK